MYRIPTDNCFKISNTKWSVFLWKHVEIQIYIAIMCSIVLRKQVAGPDNLPKKKKKNTGNIQNRGKQFLFLVEW